MPPRLQSPVTMRDSSPPTSPGEENSLRKTSSFGASHLPPSPPPLPPRARSSSGSSMSSASVSTIASYQQSPPQSGARHLPRGDSASRTLRSTKSQGRLRGARELRPQPPIAGFRGQSGSTSSFPQEQQVSSKIDPEMALYAAEDTLKKHIRAYGSTHAATAPFYIEVGNLQFRLGNCEAAAMEYKKAVACEPGDHLVSAYSNLATVNWKQGDVSQAIHFLQQAWAMHELATLSSGSSMNESPTAANISHQLGLCHALSNNFDKALSLLEQARDIRVRLYGPSDVNVGRTMDAIGKVHWMRGDLDSAMQCHAAALSCLTKANVSTLTTLQNMARVHMAANRLEASVAVLSEVAKLQKTNLGQDKAQATSSSTRLGLVKSLAETLDTLAELYSKMGHLDQANRCRQEAFLVRQQSGL